MKKVKIEIFKSSKGNSIFVSNDQENGEFVVGVAPEINSELVCSYETDVDELIKVINDMSYSSDT